MSAEKVKRVRIRELIPSLYLGRYRPGPLNSITDVPGVLASAVQVHAPRTAEHHEINTGVTAILPRKNILKNSTFAGIFRFNGAGEMTGTHWLEECGLLNSPIIITGTLSIGAAHEGVVRYFVRESVDKDGIVQDFQLPVVAETWDGFLSDVSALAVRPEHVLSAIDSASTDALLEGNTGGGTAMICHGLKGGTGSASRLVPVSERWTGSDKPFTIGVAVQANYGRLHALRIGGVTVGKILLDRKETEAARTQADVPETKGPQKDGSIIVVIGTDAPVMPLQLQRIAKRATNGLSRVGGYGSNSSGDIFVAFSTASEIPAYRDKTDTPRQKLAPEFLEADELTELFEATADAVEEAIYNALCKAETLTGPLGRKVEAINLADLKEIVEAHINK